MLSPSVAKIMITDETDLNKGEPQKTLKMPKITTSGLFKGQIEEENEDLSPLNLNKHHE